MQYRHEGNLHRYRFDSLAELGRWIDDTPRTWRASVNSSEAEGREYSWDLGADFADAVHMAKYGWDEGVKETQHALKHFVPKTPAPARKHDFYGDMPHVARFCAGAPDSMLRFHRAPTVGGSRVLTLYVPVSAVSAVSARCMRNFGLGVAQYVYQLELEGVRVELHGAFCSTINGQANRIAHTWLIKRADQPLDLAVVAFSIGHPAMFRRLGFALRERSQVPTDSGYGQTVPLTNSDIIDMPRTAYILNGMANADTVARTKEDALEYIEKQITRAMKGSN